MDALRGMKLVFRERPQLVIPKKSQPDAEKEEGESGAAGEEKKSLDDDNEKTKEGDGEKGEDWKAMLDLSDDEKKRRQEGGDKEDKAEGKKVRFSTDILDRN